MIPSSAGARSKELSIRTLPLEERIRRRAYEIYLQRGDKSGSDVGDWLQAKGEILWAEGDARVDEASEESFPASDAPAY